MMKAREAGWVVHAELKREIRNLFRILIEKLPLL
jgi:hypothetical protein